MQNADTAMYHAKASGRNNYQFFRADMNTRAVRRLFVENSLRRALKQGEFLLHYQPKIDLASGAMTGAEALIRWQDPDLGLVYAGAVRADRGRCGLIVPIGRWVLREACRQVQAWLDSGLPAVPVSVNISAVEFRHEGLSRGRCPDPEGDRPGAALSRTGTDRKHPHARRRIVGVGARSTQGHGGAACHRRLRYRLFEPELSEALPDRHPEDRPVLRARHRHRFGRCNHRRPQ